MTKALVVNLASSTKRKQHMVDILSGCSFLDVDFIDAVDGRVMSQTEIEECFDTEKSYKRYGRRLGKGEIGCALSHRKCYQTILDSDIPYALVLEDDISIIREFSTIDTGLLRNVLEVDKPAVVFLSGDYWRLNSGRLVKVFDANGAYAYLINRAAAKAILSSGKPYTVADDWRAVKKLGVSLYAVSPYCIDANIEMDKYSSDVKQDSWGNNKGEMSLMNLMETVKYGLIERLMTKLGFFESKVRVIDNKIVEQ